MNQAYLKKLISGFLLIAAAASSFAVFLSLPKQPDAPETKKRQTASINAFVEPLSEETMLQPVFFGTGPSAVAVTIAPTSTNNITDQIIFELAQELVAVNPKGPVVSGDNLAFATPDVDTFLDEVAGSKAAANFTLPDWDLHVAAEMTRAQWKQDTSTAAVKKYQDAIAQLLSVDLASAEAYLDQTTSLNADATVKASLTNALTRVQSIQTPENLADFHRSLIRMIVFERNAADLLSLAEDDPLRAALTAQQQEGAYYAAMTDFQSQFYRISALHGPFFAENAEPSIVARMLGIQKANAQWIVHDPVALARLIWEYVKTMLLDIVRDKVIHRLVQQTISWIQGGGSPQFVTNWKQLLVDAGDVAAGQAIGKIVPGLCRPFAPLIRLQLELANLSNPPPVRCTLEDVVKNIEAFYDDFSQGGWLGYGAIIMPGGNYFGQLLEADLAVARERAAAAETKKADAQAGGGFPSTRVCVKFEETCPAFTMCMEESGDETLCKPYECPPNKITKVCAANGWQNTTPGQAIGQIAYNALSSPIQRIVNAEDIRALTSSLVNSALSKLTKLVAGKPDRKGLLGIGPTTIGTPVGGQDGGACTGLTGDRLTACLATLACADLSATERVACLRTWQGQSCSATKISGDVTLNGNINVDVNVNNGGGTNPGGGDSPQALSVDSSGDNTELAGDITLNGINCVPVYGGTPGTDAACAEENCNGNPNAPGGCNCRCRDGLNDGNFCFLGSVQGAQAAVRANFEANNSLDVGLRVGGSCGDPICVTDGVKYGNALAAELAKQNLSVLLTEEMEVTGTCSSGGQVCGQAGCIGNPRTENYAIVASDGRIRGANQGRAVCPVGS